MPIDASIPLGIKQPDQMQNLSSLLSVAKGAQDLQTGGIALREKQGLQQVMADPSNYTDENGNIDTEKARRNIMAVAPTTGLPVLQNLLTAQKMHTEAQAAMADLDDKDRLRLGNVVSTFTPDTPPDVVHKALDKLDAEYQGRIKPMTNLFRQGYNGALQQGPQAVQNVITTAARSVLPQKDQRELDTPSVLTVDDNQHVNGYNMAPGVRGMPQGSQVLSVQKQLPPTTPTVGPNNQPGYLGPQPASGGSIDNSPAAYDHEIAQSEDSLKYVKDENSRQQLQDHIANMKRLRDVAAAGPNGGKGFVPAGPVPGANESKAASVQVMNDHWTKINQGAADNPTAMSLLGTIRDLAPQAITGTEAGKKAYWNGLFNSLGIQTKASGDLQKDTDILNKAMAQLNLATPATTDAMRTLVEAGRPHSTMSAGAIKEAAQQIEGQLKANMAMRNLLTQDKRYADATGDVSHYDDKKQALEKMLDPRIFQYESLSQEERKAFRSRMSPDERAKMAEKIRKLEAIGALQ